MNIQDAYNEWSHTYDSDKNDTRDLDRIVTERVLGKSHFKSVVDVGCGTGKNAVLLSRIGERVHALDFSDGMIQKAKAKLVQLKNVSFSVADVTDRWPCDDQFADLVTCNLVLEHIRDLSSVFSQAARVLVKGGWFFSCELHPCRQYQGIVAHYQSCGQTTEIQAFVHHISDFLGSAHGCGFTLKALQE